jgi:hypothetical protein
VTLTIASGWQAGIAIFETSHDPLALLYHDIMDIPGMAVRRAHVDWLALLNDANLR